MAATHPPASPVEEHHQQSASKKSQDSLINLLIVPERDKDRYCRREDGEGKRRRELPLSRSITVDVPEEGESRKKGSNWQS